MARDADVVVVGAGPVGAALSVMLGMSGVRTVLLDRARFPRDKPCGEGLMPAGARVLEGLGVPLDGFPALSGVSYRLPGSGGSVAGNFAPLGAGRGARRLVFDELLAATAAATPNVEQVLGCAATAFAAGPAGVAVSTAEGEIRARFLVGADGQRSRTAKLAGWARPPRSQRYALVGHLAAHRHGFDRVLVTLLPGCEVYLAPTGPDEVLAAVLGGRPGLRTGSESVREAYRRRVGEAHPELASCSHSRIRGAGPFWTRPRTVAGGRVFLVGDAAGFLDPLTGDGISAGLLGARRLAGLLAAGQPRPEDAYRRWEARQWRRRVLMTRLALALTGSSALARRAVRGLSRRPAALGSLLAVNDGSRGLASVSPRDWAALAGI